MSEPRRARAAARQEDRVSGEWGVKMIPYNKKLVQIRMSGSNINHAVHLCSCHNNANHTPHITRSTAHQILLERNFFIVVFFLLWFYLWIITWYVNSKNVIFELEKSEGQLPILNLFREFNQPMLSQRSKVCINISYRLERHHLRKRADLP